MLVSLQQVDFQMLVFVPLRSHLRQIRFSQHVMLKSHESKHKTYLVAVVDHR
jgi:hypothetical protein